MFFSASRLLIPATRQDSSPGAIRRVDAASLLSRAGMAIWHGLENLGQARAHKELRLMADRCAFSDPELASQLRAASSFDAISRQRAPATTSPTLATATGAAAAPS